MAKRKKENTKFYTIIVIVIFLLIIVLGLVLSNNNKELEDVLNKEGYTTEDESAFYKKIVTNNTLDDYYNDITNSRDSEYEEYYFSKESNDFIELKMSFQNNVTTSLNITSDLKNLSTSYNYELTYKDAHLLLEGNDSTDFTCNIVLNEKVNSDTINTYCNMIKQEIETFTDRRTNLLKNKKIQEIVQKK